MATPVNLTTVGWREFVSLPEWGVNRIRAKIDTGARTSAIHVAEICELDNGRVRFQVVIREHPVRKTIWVEADPVRVSVVKPSSGETQRRIVCRTPLHLAHLACEIELSLVCRQGMLCRMLLGRTALAGLVRVDPAHKYLLTGKRAAERRRTKDE
jgi:hypothetical protein